MEAGMNPYLRDSERAIIGKQAAKWLCVLAEHDAEQREAFVAWLKKSPRHVEEFLLVSTVWQGMGTNHSADPAAAEQLIAEALAAPPLENIVPITNRSVARSLHTADAASALLTKSSRSERNRQHSRKQWMAGIAAGIAVIAVSALWAPALLKSYLNTYSTTTGEQHTVRLEDGSVVRMNAQSRIRVNFSNTSRDIELLAGEAIFKVEQDSKRPFKVHTRDAVVRVLGTQFNVYRRENRTTVSVLEGKVQVLNTAATHQASEKTDGRSFDRTARTSVQLTAGDEASIAKAGRIVKDNGVDLARTTAWLERRLVFREDRLEDIANEFSRYSPRRIQLTDEASRNKRITGTFDADNPQSLVLFLETLTDVNVKPSGDNFIVTGR